MAQSTPAFDPNASYTEAAPKFDSSASYNDASASQTSASSTASAPAGDYLSKFEDAVPQAAKFIQGGAEGMVDSMGQTIQSLPWVGKKIISPEALQAERAVFAPNSPAEKDGQYAGQIAEPILEFVLGDEALKGLALADKVGLAGKISEIAKTNPYIAKLIQHGVLAAGQGTVGTAEALAKGATLPQAVKTGTEVGAGSFATGVALDAAAPVASRLVNPFRKGATIAGEEEPGIVGRVMQGRNVEQAPAQAATRAALQTAGSDVGLSTAQPQSLRTAAQEPIAAIRGLKQNIYGQVDQAAGTDLKGLFDRLDKIEDAIDQTAPGSPEEARFEAQRTSLQQTIQDAKDEALKQGVDADKMLKQGDALHTRESALRELQKKVLQNPNVLSGNAAAGTAEKIDVDATVKALQKMQDDTKYGAPRLEQALGGKAQAKQLLNDMYASQRRGVRAVDAQKFVARLGNIAKWTGIVGGPIGGAVGAYEALKP